MCSNLLSGGKSSSCQSSGIRKEAVWGGRRIAQYFASYKHSYLILLFSVGFHVPEIPQFKDPLLYTTLTSVGGLEVEG